jgi:hypothetical protein
VEEVTSSTGHVRYYDARSRLCEGQNNRFAEGQDRFTEEANHFDKNRFSEAQSRFCESIRMGVLAGAPFNRGGGDFCKGPALHWNMATVSIASGSVAIASSSVAT